MSHLASWGRGGLIVDGYLHESTPSQIPNASLPNITILPLLQYPG